MNIREIDIKTPFLVLAVCFAIGGVINYFSTFHWVPAGLMVLFALLINGLIISIEDKSPDGFDYIENESHESKAQYKSMVRIQLVLVTVVLILGLASGVYFHS